MDVSRIEVIEFLRDIYPFRKLDESLIEFAAGNFEPRQYQAGDVIFRQDEPARFLYILMDGAVNLSRKLREGKSEIISSLSLGNIFGYEMISEDEVRLTTATAISSVIVLRIDQDRLIQLVDRFPEMVEALQLLYESYQLRLKVRLDWLGSDEAVYLIARRHPMFLAIRLVPIALFTLVTFAPLLLFFLTLSDGLVFLLILLILDILVIAGWFIWAVSDWANDYSILTNRRVVFLEKVVMLYDSRQESPLTSIMSVSTDTHQIGRMLSYGDVVVHTYAGKIILPYLKSYPEVAKIVEAEWNLSRLRMSKTERVDMERTLRMRLGIEAASGKPDEVPQKQ
ncbi:MAG: cyclic nucleotide-binding domain-containing protein, partial [Anaerolineaceae bacterium]|nr:cyclic nucleotide-binding domain-containing protein [Anaerolineaceae bacterium]